MTPWLIGIFFISLAVWEWRRITSTGHKVLWEVTSTMLLLRYFSVICCAAYGFVILYGLVRGMA